ncbi:MAG: pentapeptide repeat-containing protein [Bacteroidota bacterium]
MMGDSTGLTVLHISDPQFGRNHRFGRLGEGTPADLAFDTLLQRICDDLDGLKEREGLRPDLFVMSGDLAEHGKQAEFEDGAAFLIGVADRLGLARDRVIVVPGNHDVNWTASKVYFLEQEEDNQDPVEPYWPKWKRYVNFFDAFYQDVPQAEFTEDQPWSLFTYPELKVVVAGLNSTMAESHLEDDHYGCVGEFQLDWFKRELAQYREEGWFRLGVVHHNLRRGPDYDNENLRDVESLRRILGSSLHAILHGHTHDGKVDWLDRVTPILATGSAALTQKALQPTGGVPNQYQVLQFRRDGFTRWTRQYAPEQKRWVADPRTSGDGNQWIVSETCDFSDAGAAFPASDEDRLDDEEPETDFGYSDERKRSDATSFYVRDDFLERVRAATRAKFPGAEVERVRGGLSGSYLRVTKTEGGFIDQFPVGAVEGSGSQADLDAFLTIMGRYRASDMGVQGFLLTQGSSEGGLVRQAKHKGVRLRSFSQYEGLIDFTSYLAQQNDRLRRDETYPEWLYVPQRIDYQIGEAQHTSEDALQSLEDWVATEGRFLLVLGGFGTGKTFLLKQLARRLGTVGSPLIPMLVEMRQLEKSRDLNELIAQHFAKRGMEFRPEAFHYMRRKGRIVLLFDGFDELVLRVTYERAVEHLQTLLGAAEDEARVVVTSRTNHFRSKRQVQTALGSHFGHSSVAKRTIYLQPFERPQIRQFLIKSLQSEEAADARMELFRKIRDLQGLAENPRMLSFLIELDEENLRDACDEKGEITAASLYRVILTQWLSYEVDRQEFGGSVRALSLEDRWHAAEQVALYLWRTTAESVPANDLPGVVAFGANRLATLQMDAPTAVQQTGSGTLLIRDDEGRFSFVHQSIMEWLVAEASARDLRERDAADVLSYGEMSSLMADFLCDLADRDRLEAWVQRTIQSGDATSTEKRNALLARERIGGSDDATTTEEEADGQDFSGLDLSGEDFSGQDLRGARFVDATLRDAVFTNARLNGADLSGAVLRNADLTDADLGGATLSGADLRQASLLGANLWDVHVAPDSPLDLRRAKLIGATINESVLERATVNGAALPDSDPPRPMVGAPLSPQAVAISPDGEWLAVASGREVQIWDRHTQQEILRLEGHTGLVLSVAFSPDGATLASGGRDGTVRLWEAASGRETARLDGHTGLVQSVAFSPDGATLASGDGHGTVRLWDAPSGRETARLDGHTASVQSVALSPDGATLASGDGHGTVRLWDAPSGRETARLDGHTNSVHSVAFSPDGAMLASGSADRTLRLWDAPSGRETARLRGHTRSVFSVDFAPGGVLASSSRDGAVRLWNAVSGRETARLRGHTGSVWSIAFSPDGATLASGGSDNTVCLWDAPSGRETTRLRGHTGSVWSVAFSPGGDMLASGGTDEMVHLWDAASGRETARLVGHTDSVQSVTFSPDGATLASGSNDNTVCLWDAASGRETARLVGHTNSVRSVAFSPDGAMLASGGSDNIVRLWEAVSGRETARLEGHTGSVQSVAFSPDGATLASGASDETVGLWDAASGELVAVLVAAEAGWVVFRGDGRYRASGTVQGAFWHVVNQCRFEIGELDPYLNLRLADDEPLRPSMG